MKRCGCRKRPRMWCAHHYWRRKVPSNLLELSARGVALVGIVTMIPGILAMCLVEEMQHLSRRIRGTYSNLTD